jgi:RNA polymerase sigma-70 factor (ECF subfamily)
MPRPRACQAASLARGHRPASVVVHDLHNQHVNQVRRSVRTGTTVELDEAELLLSQSASQDKVLELRDLDRALGQLPAEQRAVILLVGLEGMSYGDVAGARHPDGTVRSRLSRGRLALRVLMG